MSTTDSDFVLFHYTPSKPAAILFVVLFILTIAVYAVQTIHSVKKASKEYMSNPFEPIDAEKNVLEKKEDKPINIVSMVCVFIPFFVGGIMEVVGYIARVVSSSNSQELAPYIIQALLLLVAPALMAATIYMIFGRLLQILRCQSLMLVSARFGTTFFVIGDVFSFFLQAAGGGLMSQQGSTKTGSTLVTIGLFIQIAFFGFFIVNEIRFTLNVKTRCQFYESMSKKWVFVNGTLLLSSILIMLRSIVRVIEFIQGFDGYIISHECFIYIFDAVPMLFVIIAFSVGSYFGNLFDIIVEFQILTS
ncbi:CQS_1a_G0057270.mRNA.1.CDS.1 [Saccharomyces cerevisiae]|nr:CQS_1a_G0057270.mRNA.1.CDS.1 [Saccharomyces cerevisiae]CAI7489689.1 CQS_1a_G0057270.mRNA.1.CDS.1 [Saccharomyces cerevisiae]